MSNEILNIYMWLCRYEFLYFFYVFKSMIGGLFVKYKLNCLRKKFNWECGYGLVGEDMVYIILMIRDWF